MKNIFRVSFMALLASTFIMPVHAMGKKPAAQDPTTGVKSTDNTSADGNPGNPQVTGTSGAPATTTPINNVAKPTNPNLPSVTGTSGSTGMNGTGMGSGTSH